MMNFKTGFIESEAFLAAGEPEEEAYIEYLDKLLSEMNDRELTNLDAMCHRLLMKIRHESTNRFTTKRRAAEPPLEPIVPCTSCHQLPQGQPVGGFLTLLQCGCGKSTAGHDSQAEMVHEWNTLARKEC